MPKERLSIVTIKEVLRLKYAVGLSNRQIAASGGVSHSTIAQYLRRAQEAGLTWPLPEGLSDTELEQRLFRQPERLADKQPPRVRPDWTEVHQQMKRKGVTLLLLWQEYKEQHPESSYQYSQFAHHYRQWRATLDVVMRQTHRAGEKLFVDYAGQTVEVNDRHSGEVRSAEIFVAVLGASNYTYAEATWTQQTTDWIGAHIRAFEFLGGCPAVLVPDNLKAAVTTQPHRYEPQLNRSYSEMAGYYGVAIVPARVRKPRDKAKAENGVQRVEQWMLARLRNQSFFSLGELNRQLARLLNELNDKPFQQLPGSRRSQFEALDRPALQPLPAQRYEYAEWLKVRVAPNIHVKVDQCYYSVPFALIKKELEVRLSATTVEVFHRGERVAVHRRCLQPGHYQTVARHMPEGHQRHLEWTPQRLLHWAAETGPHTQALVQAILDSRPFPQQAFNACLGVMRLGQSFGAERLEAACRRALHFGTVRYKSLESILKNGLDRQPLPSREDPATEPLPTHANVRGAEYYH
jgi:transposase